MSRQYWEEAIAWATTDGTAIANTGTETILMPNITIPGNLLQDGRVLRGRLFGRVSTTATPTLTIRVRYGGVTGTVLASTGAMTTGSGVVNVNWECEFYIQTRSNGSSGVVISMGEFTMHTSATAILTAVMGSAGTSVPATATIDLTADTALSVTAQWGTPSASNTIQGHIYTLEAMN